MKGIALVPRALVVEVYCSERKLPDSFSDPCCSYQISIFSVQIPLAICGANSLRATPSYGVNFIHYMKLLGIE
jgi:hypothetical protein